MAKKEFRYYMRNNTHYVEAPYTPQGKLLLTELRAGRQDLFKYCRIIRVVQYEPEKVKIGEIHSLFKR